MRTRKETLPKISRKKKIDIDKFEKLAKRIKRYFEEEERYLEKVKRNENSNTSGVLSHS